MQNGVFSKIKQAYSPTDFRMYLEKVNRAKRQLKQVLEGTDPEFNEKLKMLDTEYQERIYDNDCWREEEVRKIKKIKL